MVVPRAGVALVSEDRLDQGRRTLRGRRGDLDPEALLVVVALQCGSLGLAVGAGIGLEQGRIQVEPGEHPPTRDQVRHFVTSNDDPDGTATGARSMACSIRQ